ARRSAARLEKRESRRAVIGPLVITGRGAPQKPEKGPSPRTAKTKSAGARNRQTDRQASRCESKIACKNQNDMAAWELMFNLSESSRPSRPGFEKRSSEPFETFCTTT